MVAPLLIGPLMIYHPIPAASVARALVNLSFRDKPGVSFSNIQSSSLPPDFGFWALRHCCMDARDGACDDYMGLDHKLHGP
jgi:hypothetical protein